MPENKLDLWTKDRNMIFIDVSEDGKTFDWARIGKSTVYDLALNPNVKTVDYIENAMPQDEVSNYQPELPNELATYGGDKAFDFMFDLYLNLPTGTALNRKVLLVYPRNIGTDAAPEFVSWLTDATIVLNNYNPVDQKLTFTIKINGIELGTCTVADGQPSFSKAE